MSKPRVLILGGVGFIGRNLATYLVENDLASKVRVADKVLPSTAYLTPRQRAAFEKVEFVQANLAREAAVAKAFTDASGEYNIVFNCAAMTKYGQEDMVYKESVLDLALLCAREAAKRGVTKFVEISTAQVYPGDKKPSAEDSKLKPWTSIAEYKMQVEQQLAAIPGLNYCIVRPAIVYGVGDMLGLMPRMIIAAVYKQLGEPMKLLWTEGLRLNTVHVQDVVRGLWHVALHAPQGAIFNLADKGDSTQDTVNVLLRELFGIEFGYVGSVMSNLAKLNMKSVTEDVNDKHVEPWVEMCRAAGISNTPLTPYLDQELLYNNSTSVDGSAIEATGFRYEHPVPTAVLFRESLQAYIDQGLFPKGFLV